MRFAIFTLLLLCSSSALLAQSEFKIKGINVKASKTADLMVFPAKKLKWSSLNSRCIAKDEVSVGNWLSFKPNEPEATIYLYGTQPGDQIEGAVIYLGIVTENNELKEVSCVKASAGEEELIFSANNLIPKAEYYILIGGAEQKVGTIQRFNIKSEYIEEHDAAKNMAALAKKAFGRVFDGDGKPKARATVTLLNAKSSMPIESVESADDGSFKFENLPLIDQVIARIDEADPELRLDLYLVNADGKISRRARKVGPNLFGFVLQANTFHELVLLSDNDWKLDIDKGTIGVTGKLVDSETYLEAKPNVEIGLYNSLELKTNSTTTDAKGRFNFRNLAIGQYSVRIGGEQAKTYSEIVLVDDLNVPFGFSNSDMLDEHGLFSFKPLPIEVVEMKRMKVPDYEMSSGLDLSKMTSSKAITLDHILFESGSVALLSSSFVELDELASALKQSDWIKIEIDGHTDNQGSEELNKKLSQGRAESVKTYLVEHGIESSRLLAKGYGEEQPIATNDTEEGRKMNRRVTIQKMD